MVADNTVPMIRPFQLIFDTTATWEKIENDQRGVPILVVMVLLPLLVISLGLEGFLMYKFGDEIGPLDRLMRVSPDLIVRYEVTHFVLFLVIVFGGSALVTKLGESFHSRHNYRACFTTLTYSLSPLYLSHILDGWPEMNTWICFVIGILLSVSLLYKGIPRTLRPEPSNALGMYLFLSVFLIMACGLAHYLGTLVLEERILAGVPRV